MPSPAPAGPGSRRREVAYWSTTTLVAGELLLGGAWDIMLIPYVRKVMRRLGYPPYFAVIMGAWKLPGAVTLLAPGLPRLKEWAYAGAVFTYTGAAASHLVAGDTADAAAPLIFTGLAAASWALRPPARRSLPARPAPATHSARITHSGAASTSSAR